MGALEEEDDALQVFRMSGLRFVRRRLREVRLRDADRAVCPGDL